MPTSKRTQKRQQTIEKRAKPTVRMFSMEKYQKDLARLMKDDFLDMLGDVNEDFFRRNSMTTGSVHTENFDHVSAYFFLMVAAKSISEALSMRANLSYEERKDRIFGVATYMVATLLNVRPDYQDLSGWLPQGVERAINERMLCWGYDKPVDNIQTFAQFASCFVMTQIQATHALTTVPAEMLVPATPVKEALSRFFVGIISPNNFFKVDRPFDGYKALMTIVQTCNSEHAQGEVREEADGFNMELTTLGDVPPVMLPTLSQFIADPVLASWAKEAEGEENVEEEQTLEEEMQKWNARTDSYIRENGFCCNIAKKEGREPNDNDLENDTRLLSIALYFLRIQKFDNEFVLTEEEAKKAMEEDAKVETKA